MATTDTLAAPLKDVLNFEGLSTQDYTAATGSDFTAQGASLEQRAYLTAQKVAQNNEELAVVSGNIQNTQTEREVRSTIGSQRATVAAAGFGDSGSALALARSSRQQGYLHEQLTGVQSQIEAGGYAAQATAAGMEASATGVASTAATTLAAAQRTNGALMQSYATAEAGAIDALTAKTTGGTAGTGATFNGLTWTPATPPTPSETVATNIAGSVAGGQPLPAGTLAAAAVQQGGGGPPTTIPRFNGVTWSR